MAGGPAPAGAGIGVSAKKSQFVGILMVAFAAFGGILFGYDTGTIGGILGMDDWLRLFGTFDSDNNKFFISTSRESLVVSILSAGTFFGWSLPRVYHVLLSLSIFFRCSWWGSRR